MTRAGRYWRESTRERQIYHWWSPSLWVWPESRFQSLLCQATNILLTQWGHIKVYRCKSASLAQNVLKYTKYYSPEDYQRTEFVGDNSCWKVGVEILEGEEQREKWLQILCLNCQIPGWPINHGCIYGQTPNSSAKAKGTELRFESQSTMGLGRG